MRQSASSSSSTPVRRPYLTPVRRRTTTTGGGSSSGARAMIEDSEDAEAPVWWRATGFCITCTFQRGATAASRMSGDKKDAFDFDV